MLLFKNKIYYPIFFMATTIVVGVIGFHILESRSFLDSLYLVVQILSTVGLDKQADLSLGGRVFVIVLIMFFLGAFTAAASIFIRQIALDGGVKIRNKFRERKAKKMKKHYICCGFGRLGSHAVRELLGFGCDVVVIENDESILSQWDSESKATLIFGDATEDEMLLKAGIMDASGLLCALANDADNVFVTLTARELNPNIRIVARANSEKSRRKLVQAGAERLVLNYEMGGRKMAYALMRPVLADFIDKVMGGEGTSQRLEQWTVLENSGLVGKTIREAQIRSVYGVSVIGIARQGKEIEVAGSSDPVLKAGDTLIIIGPQDKVAKMLR
ncbi:MAG: potassium channel protein [Victivallales bacterium]|nr:potassium channel protein [Victivallales bacterium]